MSGTPDSVLPRRYPFAGAPPALRDPVLLGLIGLAVITLAWFLVGPGGLPVYWTEQVGLDLGLIYLSRRVAVAATAVRPVRRFWNSMTLAAMCFTTADGYQSVVVLLSKRYDALAAAIQPALVATGVGVVVIAMLTHPLEAVGRERLRLWLDAVTVLTGVAVFIWYFELGGHIAKGNTSQLTANAATSVMMLVSAFGVVKLLLSGTAPFTRVAGVFGAATVSGLALAGMIQSSISTHSQVWYLAQLMPCILFTALPRIQEVEVRATAGRVKLVRKRAYSRMPYAAVIATQILLIIGLRSAGLSRSIWGVALGAVGITTLVLVRQLIAFHDNAALLVSLDASVTEARELQEQLRHKATHDPLTRLANRALFDEQIQFAREHAAGSDERVGVLAIDLDDFKQVNDTLGHHVGDALLVAVADRLRECVRTVDVVARLGGDEFAVLLPDASPEQALLVADRMVNELAVPVNAEGHLLPLKASIGVATGRFESADRLLREADAAMYLVKQNGKGGFRVAEPANGMNA
jgi:diguanylate cyclase (GGDEF)-like protein